MSYVFRYVFLLFLLILFNCGDLFDLFGNNDDSDNLTAIDTTLSPTGDLAGDQSFSVVFDNSRRLDGRYLLENLVLDSNNYADTVCYLAIEAHNTVRINYRRMPDMDMDIILTGDSFPDKINNIKQNNVFKNAINENNYYYRQYFVINDLQTDSLDIYTKNILPADLDDFKTFLQSEKLVVYWTGDYSRSIGIIISTIMPGGFTKSILKKLILNENIRYIQPKIYAVPD